jgi:AAA ATPase domain
MGLKGRKAEQEAINTLVQEARAGRSGVVSLVGEPGVGKSALLDDAAVVAGSATAILRARGVQSEAQIPFAGLSELLRPALQCLDRIPKHLAGALEGALALVPSRAEDRFALGAATLSLLSVYAEDRFVLVLVDDIQWLDGSSASALSFAFRRLLADPVAVVLAARTGEASFLDGSDFPQMRLEGLDAVSASDLILEIAGKMPADLVNRLHRHTGGNPLGLRSMFRCRSSPASPMSIALESRRWMSHPAASSCSQLPETQGISPPLREQRDHWGSTWRIFRRQKRLISSTSVTDSSNSAIHLLELPHTTTRALVIVVQPTRRSQGHCQMQTLTGELGISHLRPSAQTTRPPGLSNNPLCAAGNETPSMSPRAPSSVPPSLLQKTSVERSCSTSAQRRPGRRARGEEDWSYSTKLTAKRLDALR